MLMSALGLNFFALSSEYREIQSKDFYWLSKFCNVDYISFLQMPIYLRKFMINELVKERMSDEN